MAKKKTRRNRKTTSTHLGLGTSLAASWPSDAPLASDEQLDFLRANAPAQTLLRLYKSRRTQVSSSHRDSRKVSDYVLGDINAVVQVMAERLGKRGTEKEIVEAFRASPVEPDPSSSNGFTHPYPRELTANPARIILQQPNPWYSGGVLPSERPGGKNIYDGDFRAGFQAGQKALSRTRTRTLTVSDAKKRYSRVSNQHGSWWIDGFTAAIEHDRGNVEAKNVNVAVRMGLVHGKFNPADPVPEFDYGFELDPEFVPEPEPKWHHSSYATNMVLAQEYRDRVKRAHDIFKRAKQEEHGPPSLESQMEYLSRRLPMVGLNADWSVSAWHLGPGQPNTRSGDVYILEDEDLPPDRLDRFYVVQRWYEDDFDLLAPHEREEIEEMQGIKEHVGHLDAPSAIRAAKEIQGQTAPVRNREPNPAGRHPMDGPRRHQLLPTTVGATIPALYSQEEVSDPIARVKFFSPYSQFTGFATEFDGDDTLFGWWDHGMGSPELGYQSLSELQGLNRNGLPLIERDIYWTPRPLSEVAARSNPEEPLVEVGYQLEVEGEPGEARDLAAMLREGIEKSADICAIAPPVCAENLGISRSYMPQFDDPATRFLQALSEDGGISVVEAKTKVGELKATQREINARKVLGMLEAYRAGDFPAIWEPIIVSNDNFILDGHHRWAALLVDDPSNEMNVYRVDLPIWRLLVAANASPGVTSRGFGDLKKNPEWGKLAAQAREAGKTAWKGTKKAGRTAKAGAELGAAEANLLALKGCTATVLGNIHGERPQLGDLDPDSYLATALRSARAKVEGKEIRLERARALPNPSQGFRLTENPQDVWVVIGNYGYGRQTMWPRSDRPGAYSKQEASALARSMNLQPRHPIGGPADFLHWHAKPLSEAARYAPSMAPALQELASSLTVENE